MTDREQRRNLRWHALLTSVPLLLVACAAQTDPTATTSTSLAIVNPPTTSTTLEPAATTVEVCGRGTIWEPESRYLASCFLAPLAFEPDTEGWRSSRATLESVEGVWVASGEGEPAIRYVVLAYQPDNTPAEVVASIVAIEGVTPRSPATGEDTLSVEVETDPVVGSRGSRDDCVVAASSALHLGGGNESGYILLDLNTLGSGAPQLYGLGACRTFRIWAIPIDDITVTVVATTDDLDRFDELMPLMEQLVDTIQAATP